MRPARQRVPMLEAVAVRGLLLAVTVVLSVPILFLVSLAFRTSDDAQNGGWLPTEIYTGNWVTAFETVPLARMLTNSWAVALVAAALTTLVAVPAAYYTARAGRRGARLSTVLLASYCAPPVVAMLPLYYLLKQVGLTNSLLGLALVNGLANVPVAVWLLDGFVRRVPVDLEEAAWLDGATRARGILRVVVPLVAPGIAATALICLFLSYNEFLFAVSFSQSVDSQTLTVGLSLFQGDRRVQFGQQAAASLVAIAPMYLLALAAQRFLVSGLTAGSGR